VKAAARLELAIPAGANLPKFCTERAPDRLRKLATHPLRFAELHGSDKLPERERRRMTPRRPSAREGVILVGIAMFKHCDVPSLRVGRPRSDGTFCGIGHDDHAAPDGEIVPGLISETGMTPTRFRRYVALGKRAGYWKAYQHRERYWNAESGEWAFSACRVVYRILPALLRRLGLISRWRRDARMIYRQRTERQRRIYPGPVMGAAAERRQLQPGTPRGTPLELGTRRQRTRDVAGDQAAQLERLEAFERTLIPVKLGLRQKHPDWGADRIDRAARALLRGRS
jgi:hypothetical protein